MLEIEATQLCLECYLYAKENDLPSFEAVLHLWLSLPYLYKIDFHILFTVCFFWHVMFCTYLNVLNKL